MGMPEKFLSRLPIIPTILTSVPKEDNIATSAISDISDRIILLKPLLEQLIINASQFSRAFLKKSKELDQKNKPIED